MSDNKHIIDVDSEEYEDAPKGLRDAYKALRKQLETTATERDDARTRLASRAVSDVLSNKGFKNPKRVEKDLLAEGIDPLDKSAVDAWIAENGDDYAKGTVPASEPVPNEDQEAYEKLSSVSNEVKDPASMDKWELAQTEITDEMTGADVEKVYRKYGI